MKNLKTLLKTHGYLFWIIPFFILLIAAWTTLITIAAKAEIQRVPLATSPQKPSPSQLKTEN